MKKALLAVLALIICAQSGFAETNTLIGTKARVFGEGVNLLLEADLTSQAIMPLPVGTEVMVLNRYDDKFLYIEYGSERGYIDESQVEIAIGLSLITVMPILTDEEKSNISRFITDFTKTDFAYYCGVNFNIDDEAEDLLVDFALDTMWYDRNELWEAGEYEENCNYRIMGEYVAPIVKRYFGRELKSPNSRWFYYADGYYYRAETGGKINNGFAVITEVKDKQNGGDYEVYFNIYGTGCEYGDEVYSMTDGEAAEEYPGYCLQGRAVIHAQDFNDISNMTLSEYLVAY